ncbi:hypothetical protein [Tomitella cavernea]|uniref:Alkaline shock response membrane anchor protein AmaP n=1 Tax=Tomitella cavernea TaxID=1387982 RepID=A0ABP9CCX3_9ACTN|nr:hypothetical protein [Tomitella cavernea]
MNVGRGLGGVGRVVVAAVGLALIAVGGFAIAFWAGTNLSERWSIYPDRQWIYAVPSAPAWHWGLIGAAVVLTILGAAVVGAHLRPRRAPDSRWEHAALGRISVAPSAIGDAAAQEIASLPAVDDVRARTRTVRGRPTLTLTVRTTTDADLDALRARLSHVIADLADTAGGHLPDVRVLLELRHPDRPSRRVE